MKVNSINSYNFNTNKVSFKHTAVPYPEYENAYKNSDTSLEEKFSRLIKKVSALFSPEVKDEAASIKSNIDNIYAAELTPQNNNPKKELLSVIA